MTDQTTQNGSNEPNLESLVARLAELKKLEDDAKLARVAHEARILPFLEQVEEGSKTTTLANGTKDFEDSASGTMALPRHSQMRG